MICKWYNERKEKGGRGGGSAASLRSGREAVQHCVQVQVCACTHSLSPSAQIVNGKAIILVKGPLMESSMDFWLLRITQTFLSFFPDYYGNIVVKLENNIMFFFKINIKDAVKLHLWTNNTIKSLIFLNTSGQGYLVYVSENGTISPQEYPVNLEAQSIALKTKEKCPFVAFRTNILYVFYILDKGQNLTVQAQVVYPENTGLYIIVESYGSKILKIKKHVHYEIALGYCTKTMVSEYFLNFFT